MDLIKFLTIQRDNRNQFWNVPFQEKPFVFGQEQSCKIVGGKDGQDGEVKNSVPTPFFRGKQDKKLPGDQHGNGDG